MIGNPHSRIYTGQLLCVGLQVGAGFPASPLPTSGARSSLWGRSVQRRLLSSMPGLLPLDPTGSRWILLDAISPVVTSQNVSRCCTCSLGTKSTAAAPESLPRGTETRMRAPLRWHKLSLIAGKKERGPSALVHATDYCACGCMCVHLK